ncbi:MAG: hypothetical protein U0X92_04345 [Anaerolineales bacterium]
MSRPPHIRNRFVLIGDIALIVVSVLGSFALRLNVDRIAVLFSRRCADVCRRADHQNSSVLFLRLISPPVIHASTGELRLITAAVTSASVLVSGVMLLSSSARTCSYQVCRVPP